MELKPGYKQTEVGVIPEDWEVKPLSALSTEIGDGIHSTPNYVRSSEFYFVNGNNLEGDRISITEGTMCVSESEYKALRKNLTDRTLLLSINGTIGNLAFYNGEKVVLGKSAAFINVAKGVSRTFILNCLKSRPTSLFFENELTGTTIRNLSLQSLRNTPVPLPPTDEEQRAIAEALGNVDALLGLLEQLIAKKRDLKQAAMQQLLTGHQRLPGFTGEWEAKLLGECLRSLPDYGINAPGVPYSDRLPAYIRITDISEDGRFRPEKPVSVGFANAENYYLSEGDLVFARTGASVGKSYLYKQQDGPLVFAGFLIRVRPDPNLLNASYLSAYVTTDAYWNWVRLMSMRSGQPGINGNEYAQLPLTLPPLPEQTAIAEVLSDMDAELAALEQRLAKTRALKQGMMQELLTGRIRLV